MYYLDIYGTEELSMKKKNLPRKEKGRRKFVGAAVAICPAKFRLLKSESRKKAPRLRTMPKLFTGEST